MQASEAEPRARLQPAAGPGATDTGGRSGKAGSARARGLGECVLRPRPLSSPPAPRTSRCPLGVPLHLLPVQHNLSLSQGGSHKLRRIRSLHLDSGTKEAVSVSRTSNQAYGSRAPSVHEMPKVFYPNSDKFSRQLAAGGMFRNNTLNVCVEKSVVTGPDNYITSYDRFNFHPSYNVHKPSICD